MARPLNEQTTDMKKRTNERELKRPRRLAEKMTTNKAYQYISPPGFTRIVDACTLISLLPMNVCWASEASVVRERDVGRERSVHRWEDMGVTLRAYVVPRSHNRQALPLGSRTYHVVQFRPKISNPAGPHIDPVGRTACQSNIDGRRSQILFLVR